MVYFVDGERFPGHASSTHSASGEYKRAPTRFTGTLGSDEFPVAPHRYVLFACQACPWATRALIVRELLGAADALDVVMIDPVRDDDVGWAIAKGHPKTTLPGDKVPWEHLSEVYLSSDPQYTGNITTPALFDRQTNKIVCNDSILVMRALASFDAVTGNTFSLRPASVDLAAMDALSDEVQQKLNNAVYRAGIARSQDAYEAAYGDVLSMMEALDARLAHTRYLVSNDQITEVDVRAFCTLIRFQPVYYGLFKCNGRRLVDYEHLYPYVRDLWQGIPALRAWTSFDEIKRHYWTCFTSANPKQFVPMGSVPDLELPHDRERLSDRVDPVVRYVDAARARGKQTAGEWVRGESQFTPDALVPEAGRYVLVISRNCPWCHLAALACSVKGLLQAGVIKLEVLWYRRDAERGWQLNPDEEGCTDGSQLGFEWKYAPEIYEREGSKERSVPILYDVKEGRIVCNESAVILQLIAGGAMDKAGGRTDLDLYPEALRPVIDYRGAQIYQTLANGAYKAGFAKTQEAYEAGYRMVFEALERYNEILRFSKWICGDRMTVADLRLFPVIYRFDTVYFVRFLLDKKMVRDLPHLERWRKQMLEVEGVAETCVMRHCRNGYFGRTANGLVPVGPASQ